MRFGASECSYKKACKVKKKWSLLWPNQQPFSYMLQTIHDHSLTIYENMNFQRSAKIGDDRRRTSLFLAIVANSEVNTTTPSAIVDDYFWVILKRGSLVARSQVVAQRSEDHRSSRTNNTCEPFVGNDHRRSPTVYDQVCDLWETVQVIDENRLAGISLWDPSSAMIADGRQLYAIRFATYEKQS